MSTIIQQQPAPVWGINSYNRMSSVEELDSSLTLLSRHVVLNKNMPMTPPATPQSSRSPEQNCQFDYGESPMIMPPNTPVTPMTEPLKVITNPHPCCSTRSNAGNGGGVQTPNVAAIDNKIEQAMDLVKTHLTFAVREEVEVLRHTITDLEARVAFLENENQMLRQYAPREVVANLTDLVQNKKDSTTPPPPATLPTLPPPKVPVGFCSSSFATTLNNVVSDVRQEMAAKLSKSPGN